MKTGWRTYWLTFTDATRPEPAAQFLGAVIVDVPPVDQVDDEAAWVTAASLLVAADYDPGGTVDGYRVDHVWSAVDDTHWPRRRVLDGPTIIRLCATSPAAPK